MGVCFEGVWISSSFKEVLTFKESPLVMTEVVSTTKGQEGVLEIHVSFVGFDEFLAFYTIDSEGMGMMSFYLDQYIEKGAKLQVSARKNGHAG